MRGTRDLLACALGLGLLGGAALWPLMGWYAGPGQAWLAGTEGAVGEVLMREGIRMEEAGQYENALERYGQALAARFAGEFNRRHTEKRLGTRLQLLGRNAEAVPHLRAALEEPHAVRSAQEPLAEALYQLGQLEAAGAVVAAWRAWAESAGDAEAQAAALFHAGRLAWRAGEVAEAIRLHEAGDVLRPGGRSASDLGILYAEQGDTARALGYLDAYLTRGGSGERAAYARALRDRLRGALPQPE